MSPGQTIAVWVIAIGSILGVVVRPWRLPEAVWAIAGALVLIVTGLLPLSLALGAIGKGEDVYFFLAGMMALSEIARKSGLFDWLAALAVSQAGDSPRRLFAIVYGVGVVVTTFMSNDATAVVLTPAVYAAAKKARLKPLPYLFACAFVANAASFVLPISNPANLVVYGSHTPALGAWLARFALPACLSITATFGALFWLQRGGLAGKIDKGPDSPGRREGALAAAIGVGATGLVLLGASALGIELGVTTFACALAVAAVVLMRAKMSPWPIVRDISWQVLLLVAALFVIVEALERAGALRLAAAALSQAEHGGPLAALAGAGVAFLCNIANNLPVGLLAGAAAKAAGSPGLVRGALLVGVDIGPNLSVTGSLATILWLIALRREGVNVNAGRFLVLGVVIMPLALALALAAVLLQPW